jgi:hypothetical protein
MPPERTPYTRANLPPQEAPERQIVQNGLGMLRNWREGSAATAVVMAVLLPFAIAWHMSYLGAIVASLLGAATLALACHAARERRLTALAIYPELARLPDLAGKRRRLVSTRARRALADGLRRTAAPTQPPRRFDCCPVLGNRVAAVRPELLALAAALEQTAEPDPSSIALIHELLTNGCSPLYNPNVPFPELEATIHRARSGL